MYKVFQVPFILMSISNIVGLIVHWIKDTQKYPELYPDFLLYWEWMRLTFLWPIFLLGLYEKSEFEL